MTHVRIILLIVVLTAIAILLTPVDAPAQEQASPGQQIAVMKLLKPDARTVGVLTVQADDALLQRVTRAARGQNVSLVVGKVREPREVPGVYEQMVKSKSVEFLWIMDAREDLLLTAGFEYLRSRVLEDKVGLVVPVADMVGRGALCSVQMENGKIRAYVNHKVATDLGATTIAPGDSTLSYWNR